MFAFIRRHGLTVAACAVAASAVLVAGFAGGAGGKAAAETKKAPLACVDVANVFSRQVIGKNKLRIEDGFGRSAILTLSQPCSNMDELDHIGFDIKGSSLLCQPHDVNILHSRFEERPLTCIITDLKLMTREETKKDNEAAGATGG